MTRQNRTLSNLLVAFLLFVVAAMTGRTIVWQVAKIRQFEAEANLGLANRTLHELFDPINALIPTEMDLKEKLALLERVLSIYTPIVKRQPNDVRLRSELATIWFQLGDVTYKLGQLERPEAARLEEAQVVVSAALDHLAELIVESADQPIFQLSLNRLLAFREQIESRCKTDDKSTDSFCRNLGCRLCCLKLTMAIARQEQ